MANQIITIEYNNTPVFFQTDAFINATAIAGKFNKFPKDYLKTSRTKEYINAVRRIFLTEENQIVKVVQGGSPEEQGTWLHPKLAIDFARWLSADFAVWCDMQIEKILHQPQYGLKQLPEPKTKKALPGCLTLDQQDTIKALVKSRAEELPKEKQAGATIKIWSSVKKKFGVSYKEISTENYVDVISLIGRLPLAGELLPEQKANGITLKFESDEPQELFVCVGPTGTAITKILPDEILISKDQFYIMERKDKVSAGKLVLDYIPVEFLPHMIEVAAARLGRVSTEKSKD